MEKEKGEFMLRWKDDFSIGVEMIDKQHQKLFEIGNRAYELLNNDMYIDKYDRIVAILHELTDYTDYHFKSEEAYMESIGYKRMFTQKMEHNNFMEKIRSIDLDHIDSDQDKYLKDILEFIFTWIAEHIVQKDKLIGQ